MFNNRWRDYWGSDRDDRRRGGRPDRVPAGRPGGPLRADRHGVRVAAGPVAPVPGDPETPTCPGELGRDLVPGLPSEFAGAVQSSALAFRLAVRMLVEPLRLGADADDNTVEAALRALVGRLD